MLKYIDSHAHLTNSSIHDVEGILERASKAGLSAIINICTDIETLEKGLILAEKHPWIFNTASTTPHDVEKEGESVFPIVAACAKKGQLVAIGETGLDYYYKHSPPELQQHYLKRYLHLALECHLPVVIHCRDAFEDFFTILDSEYTVNNKHAPGVLHCFTGNMNEAEKVLERGWYLSLSGIVTFKKSIELQEVAKKVPLEQLLIETDTPFLAPQSKRGKSNEPSYLPEIAEFIASLKNIDPLEVAKASSKNAQRLFSLPPEVL